MSFSYYPYTLRLKSQVGVGAGTLREGVLLRMHHADTWGYADLHPWTELGDLPLAEQWASLRAEKPTRQLQQSIAFARLDAQARSKRKGLWSRPVPRSHFSGGNLVSCTAELLSQIAAEGFTHLKLKSQASAGDSSHYLSLLSALRAHGLKVRLDLNGALTAEKFKEFLDQMHAGLDCIDFIEDPFAWNSKQWAEVQKQFGVKLALDRMPAKLDWNTVQGAVSVVVIKPAIQDAFEIASRVRAFRIPLVVTSYLDHPLGQLSAAWVSAQLAADSTLEVLPCGLLSHRLYDSMGEPFAVALQSQGPVWISPQEVGAWGLGTALDALAWEDLSC